MVSAAGQRPHYSSGEIEFQHANEIILTPHTTHHQTTDDAASANWVLGKETAAPELIDVFNTHIIYTPLKTTVQQYIGLRFLALRHNGAECGIRGECTHDCPIPLHPLSHTPCVYCIKHNNIYYQPLG